MPKTKIEDPPTHKPVLLEEVLQFLAPQAAERYLDVTAGYGGHAVAVLERTAEPARAVLVDRDQEAIKRLKQQFGSRGSRVEKGDFLSISQKLLDQKMQFDMILADLGLSSPLLTDAARGFSLRKSGPLDMR